MKVSIWYCHVFVLWRMLNWSVICCKSNICILWSWEGGLRSCNECRMSDGWCNGKQSKGENDTTSCGSVDSERVKEEQSTDSSQLASQWQRQTVTHQCRPHDPSSLQCSKHQNKLIQLIFMCQHHDILHWEWLPAAYTAELIHCHCSLAWQIWGENGVHCSNDSNIQLCLCSIIVWYISEWWLYGKWCSVLVNQSLRLEAGRTLIPFQRSVYHALVVEP